MANQSRTLKRLGVAGVGALTILATPYIGVVLPASAAHVTGVEFYSPAGGTIDTPAISSKNDLTDSVVRLLVDAPASVTAVTYSYVNNVTNVETTIGTVTARPFTRDFSTATINNGTSITLRAVGTNADGQQVGAIAEQTVIVDNSFDTVNVTTPASVSGAPARLGRFQGQVVVSGTASEIGGNVIVSDILGDANGPDSNFTDTFAVDANGNWAGRVDTFTATSTNAYINAQTDAATPTDETELAAVYEQLVQAPTVAPTTITSRPGGAGTDIVATVVDQEGRPVAGALVESDVNANGIFDAGDDSGVTGLDGKVTLTVAPAATVGTRSVSIIVNQTNTSGFNAADGDKQTAVTQTTAIPTASTATISSVDLSPQTSPTNTAAPAAGVAGFPAFPAGETDFDINAEDPTVRIAVNDGTGQPFPDSTQFNVTVDFDPEGTQDADGAGTNPAATTVPVFSVNGFADISALVGTAGQGTYTVSATTAGGLTAAPVVYTFDEGQIAFNNGELSQVESGTNATRTLRYTLEDVGTALESRAVNVALSSSVVSSQATLSATQPSGTTRQTATTAVVVTDAAGAGSVAVSDPITDTDPATAGVQGQTEDLTITATAQGSTTTGFTVIQFRQGVTPGEIRLTDIDDLDVVASGESQFIAATPGRPVVVSLLVDNSADPAATQIPLAGQTVTLTTDKGYFTSSRTGAVPTALGDLVPATGPSDNQVVGAFAPIAGPVTVTTDVAGAANFVVAIDKDTDFDDDGKATVTVTATVGGVSRQIPIVFTTDVAAQTVAATNTQTAVETNAGGGLSPITYIGAAPLNPGTNPIEIVPATDTDVTDVNSATGDQDFFVRARDGFGNLAGVPYAVTTAGGDVDQLTPRTSFTKQTAADFEADSTIGGASGILVTGPEQTESQTITASASFFSTVYNDANDTLAGFQPVAPAPAGIAQTSSTLSDTQTVNYYTPIADQFDFAFVTTPGNTAAVNTAVTTSVTVTDQRGNPVQGVRADFFRAGPGEQSGTSINTGTFTNAEGRAGYTFTSTTAGAATVTVVVTDGSGNELSRGVQNVNFVAATQATSVTLATTPLVRYPAGPVLTGTLRNAAGAPLANRTVTIIYKQQAVAGLASFRPVLNLTTDANGVYRGTIKPTVNAVFQAIYTGTDGEAASGSAYAVTKVQLANPVVTNFPQQPRAISVRVGTRVPVRGTVFPAALRSPVVLQWIRTNGTIANLSTFVTPNAQGQYVITRAFPVKGTYRLRVLGVTTKNNVASASRTIILRVV